MTMPAASPARVERVEQGFHFVQFASAGRIDDDNEWKKEEESRYGCRMFRIGRYGRGDNTRRDNNDQQYVIIRRCW